MENNFVDGFFFYLPNNNAPDFVKGSISLSPDRFIEWLKQQTPNEKGYVKIDLKVGRNMKPYAQLNTFTPKFNSSATKDEVRPKLYDEDEINEEELFG